MEENVILNPNRSAFHAFVSSLSGAVAPGFNKLGGYSTLYSHPKFPGVCFKSMDPRSGGRGLNGLAFVRSDGHVIAVVGASLDLVARMWNGVDHDSNLTRTLESGGFASGSSLSASRTEIVGVDYFGSEPWTPYWKREWVASVNHTIDASMVGREMRFYTPITNVMEVVGNFVAGKFATMQPDWEREAAVLAPNSPWDFMGAPYADSLAVGYVSRELNFGKARLVLGDPKIKTALLNEYPTDSGIRATASSLYDACVASQANVDMCIGVYYDFAMNSLFLASRSAQVDYTERSVVTAKPDVQVPNTSYGSSTLPADEPRRDVRNFRHRPPANFGDTVEGLSGERWMARESEVRLMTEVTGMRIGAFDMVTLQKTMLPLSDPVRGGDFDVASLDLAIRFVDPGPTKEGPDAALQAAASLQGARDDVNKFEEAAARNLTRTNFNSVVINFTNELDNRVKDALQ